MSLETSLCVCMHSDCLPGFTSCGGSRSKEVLLTSYFFLFASHLLLIIMNADEMIG